MPRFEAGDVVKLDTATYSTVAKTNRDFVAAFGTGPWIVTKVFENDDFHAVMASTGEPLCGVRATYSFTGGQIKLNNCVFRKDEFLTAVHKAKRAKV